MSSSVEFDLRIGIGCSWPISDVDFSAGSSQKRTLVEFLTAAGSVHPATSALGAHPDEFTFELTVDFDRQQTSAPNPTEASPARRAIAPRHRPKEQ